MFSNDTENLEEAFRKAGIEGYPGCFSGNSSDMLSGQRDFMKFMNACLRRKGLHKQDILLKADIPLGYGYKLLSEEKRTLKRDVILRICYASELSFEELQRALKLYGMCPLYARDRRDAFLIVCFCRRPGEIHDVNEQLSKNGLEPLETAGAPE